MIDLYWTPRGPCAFCGNPDARHRIFDAISGRHRAGDLIDDLARDYGVSHEAIESALVAARRHEYDDGETVCRKCGACSPEEYEDDCDAVINRKIDEEESDAR